MAHRGVDNSDALFLKPQPFGQCLTSGIGCPDVRTEESAAPELIPARIVERADEIGDEFGIVRDVFKPADSLQLAGEVVCDLGERGFHRKPAIPGAALLAVEAAAAGSRVGEGGVDECVAGAAEDQLARIKVKQAALLRHQPSAGCAFKLGKVLQRAMVRRQSQENRLFQPPGGNQADRVYLGNVRLWRQRAQSPPRSAST